LPNVAIVAGAIISIVRLARTKNCQQDEKWQAKHSLKGKSQRDR